MVSLDLWVFLPLWGLLVGLTAGLFGVGGGGLLVPALSLFFLHRGFGPGEAMLMALGTSMATIITTSIVSARAHHRKGSVNWRSWRVMTPGVLIGTFAGTFLATRVNGVWLAGFFACFMAFVALQMWRPIAASHRVEPSAAELGLVASGIGGISALVSIGGGSLTVPYLNWRAHPMTTAVGTSAALGLPIAIIGTLGYLVNGWGHSNLGQGILGFVYLPAVALLSLATATSAPWGVKLSHRLPVAVLKKIFGVLLLAISLRMAWQVYQATH